MVVWHKELWISRKLFKTNGLNEVGTLIPVRIQNGLRSRAVDGRALVHHSALKCRCTTRQEQFLATRLACTLN